MLCRLTRLSSVLFAAFYHGVICRSATSVAPQNAPPGLRRGSVNVLEKKSISAGVHVRDVEGEGSFLEESDKEEEGREEV